MQRDILTSGQPQHYLKLCSSIDKLMIVIFNHLTERPSPGKSIIATWSYVI